MKGFNGPAAVEGEGGTVQTIRTQPVPPAPIQETSLTQDPLGATQTLDPTLLTSEDPPTPREESTELPLIEHLR